MSELARDPLAFVRPSPISGRPDGVARTTREVIVLCEGAGFDDLMGFIQGVKRGILEVADVVLIHNADGELCIVVDAA